MVITSDDNVYIIKNLTMIIQKKKWYNNLFDNMFNINKTIDQYYNNIVSILVKLVKIVKKYHNE